MWVDNLYKDHLQHTVTMQCRLIVYKKIISTQSDNVMWVKNMSDANISLPFFVFALFGTKKLILRGRN